jgi:putative PEP-CTERM system TPR-repeat lipoprotein
MASLKHKLKLTFIASSIALIMVGCGQKTAEQAYKDANQMLAQEEYESAVIELKHALQQSPNYADARFLLGKIYMQQELIESAQKEFEKAQALDTSNTELNLLLAKAYHKTENLVGLVSLAAHPNFTAEQEVQFGFYRVFSLLRLKNLSEAEALIEQLQSVAINTEYSQLIDALDYIQRTELENAKTLLLSMAKAYPESVDSLEILTRVYLSENNLSDATPIIEQYLKIAPDDLERKFMFSQILYETEQYQRALTEIESLLGVAPNNPRLHQLKSLILASTEQFEEALESALMSLQQGLDNTTIRFIAGMSAFMLQNYTVANEHLSLISTQMPDNHPGLKMLAAAQLNLGHSLDANELLSRYTGVKENDSELLAKAGFDLYKDGHIAEAKNVMEQLEKISDSSMAKTKLGILKLQLRDIEGIADLEAAIEKNPNNQSAIETLAKVYVRTNQLDKANALALQWQQIQPNNHQGLLLAGEIALKRGDLDAAKSAFESAIQLAPNAAQTHLALVNIYMEQEDYDGAYNVVTTTLERFPNNINAIAAHYVLVKMLKKDVDALEPLNTYLMAGKASADEKILSANVMQKEGMLDEAIKILESVKIDSSTSRKYWTTKSRILLQKKDFISLDEHYQEWTRTLPSDLTGFIGRLVMFELRKDFAGGLDFIEQNFQIASTNIISKLMHAHFATKERRVQVARRVYDSLPESVQNTPTAQGVYARLLLLEGKVEQALIPARAAFSARQSDDNFRAFYDALRLNGKDDEAYEVVSQFSQNNPDHSLANLILAQNYLVNEPSKAVAKYQAIVENNPKHFVALNNLAYLLTQQSQYKQALTYAERALALAPDNISVLDTVAQIHIALDAPNLALDYYEKAFAQEVSNKEIVLNYIEVLLQSNKSLIAQRTIDQYELSDPLSQDRLNVLKAKYNL